MVRAVPSLFLLVALEAAVAGCAPRLSPPYRDYEARAVGGALAAELRAAAVEAGWEIAPSRDPRVVTTAPRRVATGLASRTEAALDLVPLDGGHVRVYVRAERRSTVFGGRSKVYALDPGLRAAALAGLTDALRQRGLVPLGTPRDRDEDATE